MPPKQAPTEELDDNNQKILHKIVRKFLYYAKAIDPKMLMSLNSLSAVQTNPTIENAEQITKFLNYSATHLYAVT